MTADFTFAEERLRLEKADLLENVTVHGVSLQYLKGNVIFRKGEMILKCDWARFNRKTEQSFCKRSYIPIFWCTFSTTLIFHNLNQYSCQCLPR